ncbi:MAG: metallophosphoesterase [Deltaproteobacteria bacterium]|nr:MAG: metallophosphoesterase [Deltaproteobacteria bacterium]
MTSGSSVRFHRGAASMVAGLVACVASGGCLQPECSQPDYTSAECRVLAENELARLATSSGIEVRFQNAAAFARDDASTWYATGVLEDAGGGVVRARVAAPGPFAISFEPSERAPAEISVRLENVDPRATVVIRSPQGTEVLGPAPIFESVREVTVPLGAVGPSWIAGAVPCADRMRLAAVGDVQTNPQQFERIVDVLQDDAADEDAPPLLGLLFLGDLTELSEDVEFELVADLLRRIPVPVAVVPGNHDVFASTRAIYNRTFGPGNYAFEACGVHVAMLDTGNGTLAASVEGRLPALLHATASATKANLVGTHYPPHPELTGNGWADEAVAAHLLVEAAYAGVDVVLAGHIHALLDFPRVPVGDRTLRQIVTGTGGANQGKAVARYGYVDLLLEDGAPVSPCFREVPPPNWDGLSNPPLSDALPNCPDRP